MNSYGRNYRSVLEEQVGVPRSRDKATPEIRFKTAKYVTHQKLF